MEEEVMVSNVGMTKNLKEQWSNMNRNFVKPDREIKLVERENEKSERRGRDEKVESERRRRRDGVKERINDYFNLTLLLSMFYF